MTAEIRDFTIRQGETFQRTMTFRDPDREPVDLSAWNARLQVRKTFGGELLLALDTYPHGGIVLGDGEGNIQIEASAEETGAIEVPDTIPGAGATPRLTGVYELELVSPAGVVLPLLKGRFTIERRVIEP